jgi:hypothetical protein
VEPTEPRSRISSSASALAGTVEIRVREIGRDITEKVADAISARALTGDTYRAATLRSGKLVR